MYYNAQRGWLDYKRYNDNTGPDYTYKPSGRLETRLWWRGNPTILTTYSYNNAGDLQTVTHNDGTPSVTYSYDRRGRQTTVACNGMTTTFTYNDAGQLLTESYSGGTLNGLTVTSGYDSHLRRTSLSVNTQPSNINHSFTYDNASRLQTVSDGTHSATYSYLANSPLVEQITFKQNTTVRLTTTKQYDNLNRLRVISSVPSGSSAVSFQYQYNDANQRTRNTEANGDYWSYQYDTLGQVSSGKKYTSGGTPIAGRQFEYDFDDIANRDYTVADGTTTDYTANLLNQYTTRVTGGTTETFAHDEDGNLASDKLWVYTWDGENRLTKMESQTSVPDADKRKLEFEYDYQSRRIAKKVYLWSGSGYSPTPSVSLKFVYDDWNLLVDLDANSNLVRSYMWGLDLSGSEQGAGGVGGLLLFSDHFSPATCHFVACDGNGTVMVLVNVADGTVSAQYEYSPFGETLSATGSAASSNPFRFSTKYVDSESGFLYYGYRYYNPSTGRWLSREPLGELGGANLYAFARNSPIGVIDLLGFLVTSVTWTNAATLYHDWALANTDSSITPKIAKASCLCGEKITSVSVEVVTVVTILSGHYWREKVGAHELTIGQHENQHVKIDQRTGQTIEDTLKKLIGKCRNTACMAATDSYIASVVNYYNEDRHYRNARFDVFDYAEGYRKEQRRKDASYFESGMKTNQKLMEDAANKMNEECVQ